MAVAQPSGIEIDFVRNPISGSAAWFFVIIIKFNFTAIFEIKIHVKKFLGIKQFIFEARFSQTNIYWQTVCFSAYDFFLNEIFISWYFHQNNFQMVKNLSQMLSSSNSKWSKTDRSGLLLLKTWQSPIFANIAPLVVEKLKKLSSNRNLLSPRKCKMLKATWAASPFLTSKFVKDVKSRGIGETKKSTSKISGFFIIYFIFCLKIF